ncbi:PTS fructose transporter subunit IIC [Actinopolyspora mortivallis]|uniref:PTS fructose transporter subunit IIBC n=1 Tax=Actinopolyspora mortivallis TaxID=33906 RepID=A0A2T0H1R8_ACTMO|nr:fructose-specific PTS transporter subunit EIIC [Actinopolyspora mortivallis]PRW65319.1 PTS fructose transporter subunit IIBC [Actinopolyspora mortivallis]
MRVVAVTACPTGIAHTYMAAEALEQAAVERGDEISVETQGSAGSEPLSTREVHEADVVVLAADVGVNGRERFVGKPLVEGTVKQAVENAAELLRRAAEAAEADTTVGTAQQARHEGTAEPDAGHTGAATRLRQWLMTGVSYMIPFVAAGGLLIALSFALGGYRITEAPDVTEHFDPATLTSWAALANQIGTTAFDFLVPVLAGFVAYAMADRPALAPGFVGGAAAVSVGAGFLGGLVAGLLAGAVVGGLRRVPVPRAMAGIMPVVVLPLVGTLVVGVLMFVVLGAPLSALMTALTDWLNGLGGANAVLLGALLGGMIASDLGGPVNKVAYTFAVGGLTTGSDTALQIMAAVMGAGMVPPLALATAATVRAGLFTAAERDSARPAWLLGASFITEGAIPFAAADPLRVIPSMVLGSAGTGALSMLFGVTLRAPHGGLFVFPLVGGPGLYALAVALGVLVAAVTVTAAKSLAPGRERALAGGENAESTTAAA